MPVPYTFSQETLPSGDRATVIISPWSEGVGLIEHWNDALHSFKCVPTVVYGERRARQLRTRILSGEVEGREDFWALVGYSDKESVGCRRTIA